MSKIIELQEEFESLIKELERLKSINEITSSNSENAKKTIDEIKGFVEAVNKLVSGIEDDYESKKKDFVQTEKALKDALNKLVKGVDDQSEKFKILNSEHSKFISEEVESLKKQWDSRVDDYITQLSELKDKIELDVQELTRSTTDQLNSQQSTIQEQLRIDSDDKSAKLDSLTSRLDKSTELIIADLSSQIELLENKTIENRKGISELTYLVIGIGVVFTIFFGVLIYMLL